MVLDAGGNEMSNGGFIAQVEAFYALLHQAIGVRDPLVLAQMLHPGCDEKGFNDAPFFGGILEHAPAIGAVAAPLISELFDDREKLLPILRAYAVFDCDQDRSSVLVNWVRGE